MYGAYHSFNLKLGRGPWFARILSILLVATLLFLAVYTYTDNLTSTEKAQARITYLKDWGRSDMVSAVVALMREKNIENPARICSIDHRALDGRHMFAISYWEGFFKQTAYYSSTGGFVTEADFNSFKNDKTYNNRMGNQYIDGLELTMVLEEAVALCR